ncbi:cysteine-rich secretory protein LCCL domain-containing 2-like isoform X1 [Scleropages formosus]|uniref:cysteine-rich secretory protein LCCL domain-containing 2-like isoform X1 n=1 Tax=Scleropages formosus TaxID=113540 RepID=UPI0010FA8E03|nr:cysteine-rich secretory protein LCCL domain-containing 2-like isoform X1 [Scleropages formosus]
MTTHCAAMWCLAALTSAFLLQAAPHAAALFLPNPPELQRLLSRHRAAPGQNRTVDATPSRGRLAIRWSDRKEILKLHNKLRGGVYPTASNMEYMVWDDELERSAARWARQCVWDHGPAELLPSIGQNLAVHWGRYRSPAQHVQAWYDEVKDYTYPYRHECRPFCPDRCSGPMCTHYTQLVWATTSRVGCAVHVCPRMDVWREVWENAVYLVCNYSPKGNWIGEAPYKHGQPCSQCPPGYGGGCRVNLCHKDPYCPETEDMNEVEKPQVLVQPRRAPVKPAPTQKLKPAQKLNPIRSSILKRRPAAHKHSSPQRASTTKKPSSPKPAWGAILTQNIDCATRMQDRCKGTTCNRYKCPANCQNKRGRVWGTIFYDVQSSICRAALHSGAIDSSGGLVDVTRKAQLPFFVKVTKNGVKSFSKYEAGYAFAVAKVKEQSVDCYTTVAEICLFRKPASTCPRVLCPSNCKNEPSYWAPVTGSRIYSDSSSICRAGIHAGVIKPSGGYVDVVPLEKRERYTGTLKNGIQSESKTNSEGHSFRVFAVRD